LTTPKELQYAPELRGASPGWNDCVRDRFDQKTLEMGEVDFVVEAMKLLRLRANRASWALAGASRENHQRKLQPRSVSI
jgi:hypothetical protein